MNLWHVSALSLSVCLTGGLASAQAAMPGMDHSRMALPASPALKAYMGAMDAMMATMDATPHTGDADVDFLLLMIPHHQSAVDMSRTLLEAGSDPEVKAFAESVIAAQEAEIAAMRAMLARMGVEPPAAGK